MITSKIETDFFNFQRLALFWRNRINIMQGYVLCILNPKLSTIHIKFLRIGIFIISLFSTACKTLSNVGNFLFLSFVKVTEYSFPSLFIFICPTESFFCKNDLVKVHQNWRYKPCEWFYIRHHDFSAIGMSLPPFLWEVWPPP